MSKIYDASGVKLTNQQVTEVLMNEIPASHATIIRDNLTEGNLGLREENKSYRKQFAHAVLDSYRDLPETNEAEEKSKKYCRFLMEKYMKSMVYTKGEESTMQLLVGKISKG